MEQWIYFILFGAAAGWIAGQIMKGRGLGIIGNIVVGIVGALIGGWLSRETGIYAGSGLLGSLITAVVGAIVLLFIIGLISNRR